MVLRCTNRWAFRCRTNVDGERVAVRRVAGKLFQINGPATAKLLIPSMVLVLGTDSVPVPADRSCHLPSMAGIARQLSAKYVSANPCKTQKKHDPRDLPPTVPDLPSTP